MKRINGRVMKRRGRMQLKFVIQGRGTFLQGNFFPAGASGDPCWLLRKLRSAVVGSENDSSLLIFESERGSMEGGL